MSSHLMNLIPGPCFDVHVLRTSKQNFEMVLMGLEAQYGPCRATESIQEVIRALNFTMRDVEEAWNVWRSEYVRGTLRDGFAYTKSRIRAACYRRYQGRPPAAFVGYHSLYPPFRYAGISNTSNQPWVGQVAGGPVTQVDEVFTSNHGNLGASITFAQASGAQRPQLTPAPVHTSTHAQPVSKQYQAPPQSAAVGALDYPPPSHPPPHSYQPQQQQQPLRHNVNAARTPALQPPTPAVVAAVEVATRFLEAVNKAVNICIELNAM
ncbi:hypothetical protein V8E53_003254 [Lactarius tabidus]